MLAQHLVRMKADVWNPNLGDPTFYSYDLKRSSYYMAKL